jgi:hypothetical protein
MRRGGEGSVGRGGTGAGGGGTDGSVGALTPRIVPRGRAPRWRCRGSPAVPAERFETRPQGARTATLSGP